jgi:hypothetical protein
MGWARKDSKYNKVIVQQIIILTKLLPCQLLLLTIIITLFQSTMTP